MRGIWKCLGAVAGASALAGCGIGKDKLLMVTRTNIGVNAETTPLPTAEVSFSRNEMVIAPIFPTRRGYTIETSDADENKLVASLHSDDGDMTPSVLAGISLKTKPWYDLLSPSVGSVFATGDAALALAMLAGEADRTPMDTDLMAKDDWAQAFDSTIPADFGLEANSDWAKCMDKPRALFFGTDTTTGLKLSWTGTTGELPDRLNFGYNRKEGVMAPLAREKLGGSQYAVRAPSVIASVDVGVSISDSNESFRQVQFFATGKAATALALRRQVRRTVFEQLDPHVAQELFEDWPIRGQELKRFADSGPENKERLLAALKERNYDGTLDNLYGSLDPEIRELRHEIAVALGLEPAPAALLDPLIQELNNLIYRSDITDEETEARIDIVQKKLDELGTGLIWQNETNTGLNNSEGPLEADVQQKLEEAKAEIEQRVS